MPPESQTETAPEEIREQGSIGSKVYLEYFRVGANALVLSIYLLVAIAGHALYVLNDWWLAYWVQQYEKFQDSTRKLSHSTSSPPDTSVVFEATTDSTGTFSTTIENFSKKFDDYPYLHIYAVVCVTMIVMTILRGFIHFYICVMSGVHMHSKMFRGILRAPIRFFDTNPAGRILNRFSKDTGQVDELLPSAILDFLFTFGVALSVVILVSIINYFIIIITIALFGYFLWLRRYYLRTSRSIKRLEGTCRSPVFSQLSSTLQGLTTLRAFGVQKEFERRFHENQDLHSASWFLFLAGSRWFSLRVDLITAVFTSAVAFTCVVTASVLGVDSGDVGLILTMSASTIGFLQWGVRQSAEVENMMTSVERIQQYYRIPPEAAYEIPEKKPPKEWPAHGEIVFQNVSFAYYENGPVVLKNVNIKIKPKEKIGLVGRTGAGKSSLICTLFRMAELVEGEIWIDGVPISSMGLHDLRSVLSIIPQDPVLFIGTLRRNLDPFDEYTDDDLWNALEQVQLKAFIKSLPFGLETEISESGANFSAGQRQLVCLARAILQKSKILLIDEATANVDMKTDRLIQATIREHFDQCTAITIAHRINTVVDSDRVLVLDSGRVVEFGEPHILLQSENGHFANMVRSIGTAGAKDLTAVAEEVYRAKNTADKN